MKQFAMRLVYMVIGILLFAIGIAATINANIGYAPWDVFHVGIAGKTGLSYGTVSIVLGIVIIIIVMILGEKIGFGTVANMILIGIVIDIILGLHIIPVTNNMVIGVIMLIAGLFLIALGSYFYIKSAFGAGPRDSLMVVFTRKTKLPVGACRAIIEFSVAFIGWLLGGVVGIGTVISVVSIGFFIQIVFRAFKFDATTVKHETFKETFTNLVGKRSNSKTAQSGEQDVLDTK